MLPKVDWILISSLFLCSFLINFIEFEEYREFGTIWQQRVPFYFDRKNRRDDGSKRNLIEIKGGMHIWHRSMLQI